MLYSKVVSFPKSLLSSKITRISSILSGMGIVVSIVGCNVQNMQQPAANDHAQDANAPEANAAAPQPVPGTVTNDTAVIPNPSQTASLGAAPEIAQQVPDDQNTGNPVGQNNDQTGQPQANQDVQVPQINPNENTANPPDDSLQESSDNDENAEDDENAQDFLDGNASCSKTECACADTVCHRSDYCIDEHCKTRFDNHLMLEPTRIESSEVTDNGDYWECAADSCLYHYNPERAYPDSHTWHYTTKGKINTVHIPKGVRVRGKLVFCHSDELSIDKLAENKCTNDGWICYDPKGCSTQYTDVHHEGYLMICSPGQRLQGEKCVNRNPVDDNVKYCSTTNCECGQHLCGKSQYCAFGNCYYDGRIYQGFGDYTFENVSLEDCGTHGMCHNSYINDRGATHIYCEKSNNCHCKNETETPNQAIVCKNNSFFMDTNRPEGNGYERVRIQSENYDYDDNENVKEPSDFETSEACHGYVYSLWKCTGSEGTPFCKCGDTTCPSGSFCSNGICHLNYPHYDSIDFDYEHLEKNPQPVILNPKPNHDDYIVKENFRPNQSRESLSTWVCAPGKNCQCDGQILPDDAHCYTVQSGKEYAVRNAQEQYFSYKTIGGEYYNKVCTSEECMCRGQKLPENADCQIDEEGEHFACGSDRINDIKEYRCDAKTKTWVCKDDRKGCRCGGNKMVPNTHCRLTNAGFDAEYCGEDLMLHSDKYACKDGQIVCDKPNGNCLCAGYEPIEGATCVADLTGKDFYQCGSGGLSGILDENGATNYYTFEGHDSTEEIVCKKYLCSDDVWECDDEDDLSANHNVEPKAEKKRKETDISTDITLSPGKICNHVRGCFCQNALCPVTGKCTAQGCIDPLTSKPFEKQDGYLVSGLMKQCERQEGCPCGNETTPYREYCLDQKTHRLMFSGIRNNKRTLCEDNLTPNVKAVDAYKNSGTDCFDPMLDPGQYIMKDCVLAIGHQEPSCFSDEVNYIYKHTYIGQCMLKDGCACGSSTCKQGEACMYGRCIADYQCHSLHEALNEDALGDWQSFYEEDDE